MPAKIKQSENRRVPKLRFLGFSGKWEEKKLGEAANFRRGSFPQPYGLRKWYDDKNGFPFVQVFDVDKNFNLKNSTKRKITDEAKRLSVLVKEGTIVLTIQGSIGRIAITQYDTCVDRTLLIFQSFNQPMNKIFFMYVVFLLFEIEKTKAPGGTIKTITKEKLSNFKILLPSFSEQQKIAKFLGTVDEWIENLRGQKESLEFYKQGMMQKIFSQEIRFKDDDGNNFPEWENESLGEILDYEQPTNYIVESVEYSNEYKIPVLTAGKTFILGYTNETDGIFEMGKLPVIIFDDFTTAKKFVDFSFKVKSSAMKILKNKDKKVSDIRYIFFAMQRIHFGLGEEHKRFWISEYSKIKISLPSLPEQQKIAEFLGSIDNLINLKQRQITQAESWKKGLMQGLFA